jgi:hypothetical protein
MAEDTDTCSLCGSILVAEASSDEVQPGARNVCSNRDCPGRWSATQPGGEGGVRTSYDVPGLQSGGEPAGSAGG